MEHAATGDPAVALLRTAARIDPITAASFRATIDDHEHFRGPRQVAAYLGLVPQDKGRTPQPSWRNPAL